ncbi:hypothetical protein IAR50_005046 [Cryptococcus sp. DSM 104548]
MPHAPGPFDIFPPAEVHSWITDLQLRIKHGINPPDSPGPSRSPSPLHNGDLDAGDTAQGIVINEQNGEEETDNESEGDETDEDEEELADAGSDRDHELHLASAPTDHVVEISSDEEDEDGLQDDQGQLDGEAEYYEDDREANIAYDEQDELYDDDPRYGVMPEEDNQAYVGSDGDVYADEYGTDDGEDEGEDEDEDEEDRGQYDESAGEEGNESDESDGIGYVSDSRSPLPPAAPPIYPPLPQPQSQPAPVPPVAPSTSVYPGTGIYSAPAPALPNLAELSHAPSPYADPGAPISTSTPDPTFSAPAPLAPSGDDQIPDDGMDIDPALLGSGYQIDTAFLNDLVQHVAQGGAPLGESGRPGPSFDFLESAPAREYPEIPSLQDLRQSQEVEDHGLGDEYLNDENMAEEDELAGDRGIEASRGPSQPRERDAEMEEVDQEFDEQGSCSSEAETRSEEEGKEELITVKTTTVRDVIEIDSSSEDEGESDKMSHSDRGVQEYISDEAEESDDGENGEDEGDEEDEEEEEEQEEEEKEEYEGRISASHMAFMQDDSIEEEEEEEEEGSRRAEDDEEEAEEGEAEEDEAEEDEQPGIQSITAKHPADDTIKVVEHDVVEGDEMVKDMASQQEATISKSSPVPALGTVAVEQAVGITENEVIEVVNKGEPSDENNNHDEDDKVDGEGAQEEMLREAVEVQITEETQAGEPEQERAEETALPNIQDAGRGLGQSEIASPLDATQAPPDPTKTPPPTSLPAPLSPHSLQPHPPRSLSVEAQNTNDPHPSDIPEPALPVDQGEREETLVEFPDPKGAPPDSDLVAEFAYNPDPHPPSSPSLIVEPPADPRPDITFSRTVSRAATPSFGAASTNGNGDVPETPVEFPDPRLPPADAYIEAPLTPHRLEPNEEAKKSPSLRVQVGASREGSPSGPSGPSLPPSEPRDPEEYGSVDQVQAHPQLGVPKSDEREEESQDQSPPDTTTEVNPENASSLPADDDIPMAPMDDYDVQGASIAEQEGKQAGSGEEQESHEPADVDTPDDEGSTAEPDDVEQQAADRSATAVVREESPDEGSDDVDGVQEEEKPRPSSYKGKGRALEEPVDEEHALEEPLSSGPATVEASPERPPLIMSDSAVEKLRHHHGLGSSSRSQIPTRATEESNISHKRHRSRGDGLPSPPTPPVTRSHCYYEKLRLTFEGSVAVVLAPHCSLSNTEEIEREQCAIEGVPSEGEEQQARQGQLSHDNEVLQPAFSTKLRRIVGAQIFDEGCCYLLLADDKAKLPPPQPEVKVQDSPDSTARGHRSRKSLTASQISPLKPALGNPLSVRASKRQSTSLEPSTPSRRRLSREPESSQGSLAGSVTDGGEESATESPEADITPRRSTRLSLKREAKQSRSDREKRGGSSLRNLLAAEQPDAQSSENVEGPSSPAKRDSPVEAEKERVTQQTTRPAFVDLRSPSPDPAPSSSTTAASSPRPRNEGLQGVNMSSMTRAGRKRQRDTDAYRPDDESGDEGGSGHSDEEKSEDEDEGGEDQESAASLEKGTKRKIIDDDGDAEGGSVNNEEGERVAKRRALESLEGSGTPVVEAPKAEGLEQDVGNETQRRHGFGKWFRWW